jgi:hypothetical protein
VDKAVAKQEDAAEKMERNAYKRIRSLPDTRYNMNYVRATGHLLYHLRKERQLLKDVINAKNVDDRRPIAQRALSFAQVNELITEETDLMQRCQDTRVRWATAAYRKEDPKILEIARDDLALCQQTEFVLQRRNAAYDLYLSAIGVPSIEESKKQYQAQFAREKQFVSDRETMRRRKAEYYAAQLAGAVGAAVAATIILSWEPGSTGVQGGTGAGRLPPPPPPPPDCSIKQLECHFNNQDYVPFGGNDCGVCQARLPGK